MYGLRIKGASVNHLVAIYLSTNAMVTFQWSSPLYSFMDLEIMHARQGTALCASEFTEYEDRARLCNFYLALTWVLSLPMQFYDLENDGITQTLRAKNTAGLQAPHYQKFLYFAVLCSRSSCFIHMLVGHLYNWLRGLPIHARSHVS